MPGLVHGAHLPTSGTFIVVTSGAGLSPGAGTPSGKRSAGTQRAVRVVCMPSEGTARAAQLAPSAVTASAAGGIGDQKSGWPSLSDDERLVDETRERGPTIRNVPLKRKAPAAKAPAGNAAGTSQQSGVVGGTRGLLDRTRWFGRTRVLIGRPLEDASCRCYITANLQVRTLRFAAEVLVPVHCVSHAGLRAAHILAQHAPPRMHREHAQPRLASPLHTRRVSFTSWPGLRFL
eukprot:scaffold39718_cov67-Phaeocystis_antarctica.AAC.1